MKQEAISLGWRCETAQLGVNLGLRSLKLDGYKTCPFDLQNSNYIGVCECIKNDFKYLIDPNYLTLKEGTFCSELFKMNNGIKIFEKQIVNTYYGFIYNHESPGHGNLYINERWPDGINHFVNNNFEKFIERYKTRIDNFKFYLNTCDKIMFLLMRYNSIPYELCNIISEKYPNLDFEIHTFINYTPYTYSMTNEHTIESVHNWEKIQLRLMGINEENHPEEFERYSKPMIDKDFKPYDNRIKIHFL